MHVSTEELLSVRGLSFARGDQSIIQNFHWRLAAGDRFALVGSNGGGKSTLLHLLRGALKPDAGTVSLAPGATIGYLPQVASQESRGSGGESRLNALRELIAAGHAMLLLDEPENDLDPVARDRARRWLFEYTGALVIVTHRQDFVCGLADRLLVLEDDSNSESRPRMFHGDFAAYAGDLERTRKAREREAAVAEAERARLTEGLARLKSTRAARSRKPKDNDKLVRKGKIERATRSRHKLALLQERIDAIEIPDEPLQATPPRFAPLRSHDHERPLCAWSGGTAMMHPGFALELPAFACHDRERIILTGRNGSGKTSFLNWMQHRIEQAERDAGRSSTRWRALSQTLFDAEESALTFLHERLPCGENPVYRMVRAGLPADARDRPLSSFSAGERIRLWFAALTDVDFLFLDEPTNHLDFEARRALYEMLTAFDGGWLLVTHDEDWREGLEPDRLFEIRGGRLML